MAIDYPPRYSIQNRKTPDEVPNLDIRSEVNAVDDLNISNDGTESICDAVENLSDGEKLVLPPGEYLWDRSVVVGSDDIGIEGLGSSHRDVTLVFPEGFGEFFLNKGGGRGLLLKNFSINQTNDRVTGASLRAILDDALHIKDVEWLGFNPPTSEGTGAMMRARIESQDGLAVIDGLRASGGGCIGTYPDRAGGHFLGSNHEGTLYLINSDIRNLGSSAMYYTQHKGCTRIENCFLKNNDNVNVRIDGGDHPTKESWVKNTRIVVDTDNATGTHFGGDDYNGEYGGFENTRAILHESGGSQRTYGGNGGVLVENVDVKWLSAPPLSGRDAVIAVRGNHGAVTYRNLRVQIDSQNERHDPFEAKEPGGGRGDVRNGVPTEITMENCHFSGENTNDSVINVESRDLEISGSCLNFSNIDTGIKSTGNVDASDTSITTSGQQFDSSGGLQENNINSGESCLLPDISDSRRESSSESEVVPENIDQNQSSVLDVQSQSYSPTSGEASDSDSAIFGNIVTGIVESSSSDTFYIDGDLKKFQAEEGVTIIYNGEEYTPEELQAEIPECEITIIRASNQQDQNQTENTEESGPEYILIEEGDRFKLESSYNKSILFETDFRLSERIEETDNGVFFDNLEINLPGNGDTSLTVTAGDLDSEELMAVEISGSGPVEFSGLSDQLTLESNGSPVDSGEKVSATTSDIPGSFVLTQATVNDSGEKQTSSGGVPDSVEGDWNVAWEDKFDQNSLDESSWELGYGWGTNSDNHDGVVRSENVSIVDDTLTLEVTNPNNGPPYHTGAVSTLDKVTFGPTDGSGNGVYIEARIKNLDLPGTLPAFWAKTNRNSGNTWPPEIDFMEIPLDSDTSSGYNRSSTHHIHYTQSETVGDSSTHRDHSNGDFELESGDFQDDYHVFGCLWTPDQISHFVDGNLVGRTTDETILNSCSNGAPFYMMLWLGPGHEWPGNPPEDWTNYDTSMEIDFVRIWHKQ